MNILFATWQYPPEPTGGAERQARLQAEELVGRGHRVDVVCPQTGRFPSGMVGGVHVTRVRRVGNRSIRRLMYFVGLTLFLVRNVRKYDVVHVHIANAQAYIVVAICRVFRRPVHVKLACGGPEGEIARFQALGKLTRWFAIRRANSVQAISREIEDELHGIGVARDRICRIPNGIIRTGSTETLGKREEIADLRRSLGLPLNSIVFIFVGRFAVYKGIDDLIEAWTRHKSSGDLLALVGAPARDAPYVGKLTDLPNVQVCGWSNDVRSYLRASDVFVLPSHAEGMSNALLEAMSCGKAIIATDVGAAREMLNDGTAGLLVDARAPDQLSIAIERMATDESLRRHLGKQAFSAVERFDIRNVVTELERVYAGLAVLK